jgi:hypothetical protein
MTRQMFKAGVSVFAVTLGSFVLTTGTGCGSDSKPVSAPPPKAKTTSSSGSSSSSSSSGMAAKSGGTVAASGLQAYRAGLVAGQEQIDKTLTSLAALTDPAQTDLRGAYNTYCDNLARMNEHAQTMKGEADEMRASRDQYFGKWEEKVTEIDNPTIRASAEARRKRLRDSHEKIVTSSNEVRDAYQPFMKDLQDIKKFLANDLSKGAVADIADAVKKVQADGADVKAKIGAVVDTLDSVQGGA